jgi:poly(A) polymerase Pap1
VTSQLLCYLKNVQDKNSIAFKKHNLLESWKTKYKYSLVFTFLVESIFNIVPNVLVIAAFISSIRLLTSVAYTVCSHLNLGTGICGGGSFTVVLVMTPDLKIASQSAK